MSCTVKFKAINRLKEDKVISNTREILNIDKFNKLNELYTETAVIKYGLDAGNNYLFDIKQEEITLSMGGSFKRDNKRVVFRAIPNDSLFEKLEKLIKINPIFEKSENKVEYTLKSIKLLQSDKSKQIFNKGQKNNWTLDKILTELQVPKEQKQIILDYKDNYVNNIFKNLEKECS